MSKTIAVSFEEDSIKIVHASLRGANISVERTETVTDEQLDSYLRREKSRKFIVTYNFTEAHHNLITVPAVKRRHLEKIVELEIRKAVKIKDFSFIYSPVGERVIENRKMMEVSYFAVNNEEVRDVVKRFYDNGKEVKALYPSVFSVVPLLEFSDEAVLSILGSKTEKTAFLIKKGIIHFIRKFRSLTADISDIDIQDINMTINYCVQNFRISPSLIVPVGNLLESYNIKTALAVPLAVLYKPDNIHSTRETFNEFILPISSFNASKSSNILNKEFKNIYMLRNSMLYATRVFIILAVLCLGATFYNVKNIVGIKSMLNSMKKDNTDTENILSEYRARESELRQYIPMINFLNKPAPKMQKLLIALTEINMKNSKLESIEATAKDNSFLVTMGGVIHADTYTSTHRVFQDIIDSLVKIKGISILDKTVDLDKKIFSIKINYKDKDEKFQLS